MTKSTTSSTPAMRDGIVQRGNTWTYVVRARDPETGRSKPRWVGGFKSRAAAKAARDEAQPPDRRPYLSQDRIRCWASVREGDKRCRQPRQPESEFCGQHKKREPVTGLTEMELLCDWHGLSPAQVVALRERETRARERARSLLESKERGSRVYFLARGDLVKIGYARDVGARMKQLGHTLDDVIGSIPGGPITERRLHDELRDLRVRGEWFRADDQVLDVLARETEAAT